MFLCSNTSLLRCEVCLRGFLLCCLFSDGCRALLDSLSTFGLYLCCCLQALLNSFQVGLSLPPFKLRPGSVPFDCKLLFRLLFDFQACCILLLFSGICDLRNFLSFLFFSSLYLRHGILHGGIRSLHLCLRLVILLLDQFLFFMFLFFLGPM